jgi:hypothetical protein
MVSDSIAGANSGQPHDLVDHAAVAQEVLAERPAWGKVRFVEQLADLRP